MKKYGFILFLTLILIPSFVSCNGAKYKLQKEVLVITKEDGNTTEIVAELAVHQEERNWGFMKRKHIPDGTGMLFAFDADQKLHFWMKDTPHPLSIAYIDSTGLIREIHDMKPFSLYSVSSSVYVRYALEVPQGYFDRAGISVGDKVTLKDGVPLKTIKRS